MASSTDKKPVDPKLYIPGTASINYNDENLVGQLAFYEHRLVRIVAKQGGNANHRLVKFVYEGTDIEAIVGYRRLQQVELRSKADEECKRINTSTTDLKQALDAEVAVLEQELTNDVAKLERELAGIKLKTGQKIADLKAKKEQEIADLKAKKSLIEEHVRKFDAATASSTPNEIDVVEEEKVEADEATPMPDTTQTPQSSCIVQ